MISIQEVFYNTIRVQRKSHALELKSGRYGFVIKGVYDEWINNDLKRLEALLLAGDC